MDEEQTEAIAIIGMVGRFPGAPDLDTFWHNLTHGVCSLTRFSPEALAEDGSGPDYVAVRGVLDQAEWFDAPFFGFSPREAEATDPQQRVFLETAWAALEDAGYDPARAPGPIGIWAGMSNNTYAAVLRQNPTLEAQAGAMSVMLGNEKDYVALRTAYKLDLRGPAIAQNTACSTSLVAVVNAVNALLAYQCDLALAGGVAITSPQERGYRYGEGGILSPDGQVRAFAEGANGTVFGSGVGVVVLKRLSEARADGDTIHAVIRGAALNNDGSDKAGFTAPSASGQAEVIALAQGLAGVTADDITYIETHGTGTALGDPIELAGLTRAFRETTDRTGFCALGTLKPHIGHLDVASGVAGLIKTALVLKHRQLPPALHSAQPTRAFDWESSPFFLNATLRAWDAPRHLAGVSSFGFGGTNAHVVVEEAPEPEPRPTPTGPHLLTLSARSDAALDQAAANLAAHLEHHLEQSLADIAFTLQAGRRAFPHRRVIVATEHAAASAALRDPLQGARGVASASALSPVFLFPGQGAQHAGMGKAMAADNAVFRDALERCTRVLEPLLGCDLRDVLFRDDPRLHQTHFTQPALFAVSYATAQWYAAQGITPTAMAGHSVGEYVAAHLAGVFPLETALALLAERGRLLQSLPPGAMLAVFLPEADTLPLLAAHGLDLAAVNGSQLCVASGPLDTITALETTLSARGVNHKRLPTSHAFHSAMTEPIVAAFADVVARYPLAAPQLPIVSTRTGTWLTAAEATDPHYWARHLREPVRFDTALATLMAQPGRVYIECGPGRTLTGLARRRPERPITVATFTDNLPEPVAALQALGALWANGLALPEPPPGRRVPLPTYPFERQRYSAAPQPETHTTMPTETTAPSRRLAALQATLSDLSGLPLAALTPEATFSELGFDSLFLTQAAQALAKQFGVPLTFRQFLEDLTTPGAVAAYVDSRLPAETPTPAPVPAASVTALPADSTLAGVIAQQLALMQQQLALLTGGQPVAAAPTAPVPPAPTPAPAPAAAEPIAAHGPFRPIQKTVETSFTPVQQAHLDSLTAAYLARTRGSRDYTAQHRPHLADPRAVAGFKPFWKELVYPIVVERSQGAQLWDCDGNSYIDLTLGFGLGFLGHNPPFVVEAVHRQLDLGIEIGPQSPLAGIVAQKLCRYVGAERAIFCNTGSEAVMAAVRAARTVTGRDVIVTFSGAYHGVHDEVLVRGNGRGKSFPIAPGIPQSAVSETLVLEYGSDAALEAVRERAGEIAAILVEPVQSRHPDLRPVAFVQALRQLAAEKEICFIFDEIVNGFRLGPRGAAGYYGITPDLQTFGKVLGGGIPIGAVAGKAQYLDCFDGGAWEYGDDSFPAVGMTFFAGTFVRHPLALAAADAVLDHFVAQPDLATQLSERGEAFGARLDALLKKWQVPFPLERFRSMFYLNTHGSIEGGLLHFHLRLRGIHLWENRPFFLCTAHSDDDLERVLAAFDESCAALAESGFLPPPPTPAPVPLTAAQREVWLASQQSETASLAYNEALALHLDGPLDSAQLQRNLQTVVERHEALRATFSPDGESLTIAPHLPVALPLTETDDAGLASLQTEEVTRPFELAQGPLMRARLVRLAPERHVLLLTAHHIVCDGWSWGIVLDELAHLSQGETLPAAASFIDFLDQPSPTDDLTWWTEQLTPAPAPLALPTDFPRPLTPSFAGDRIHHRLPEPLVTALRKLSGAHGTTLFATLLTAYETLLERLSGQADFVVGVPAAGQASAATDAPLVGHAVRLLPVRRRPLPATTTFVQALAERKRAALDAFDHRECTFSALLPRLNLPRDPSRNPLIQATFNLERTGSGDLGFFGLRSQLTKAPRTAFQFELGFNLVDDGATIEVEASYATDLFDAPTIQRLLVQFETLLTGIVAAPETPVQSLPLLTPAQEVALLAWGDGGSKAPYPPLDELFAQQVAAYPERVAVRCGTQSLTYSQLDDAVKTLADELRAMGVRPGEPVAICLPRSVRMVVAVLATLRAGGFYVPIDTTYPPERQNWLRRNSKAVAQIDADGIERLGHFDGEPQPELGVLLYTSGSTGEPKGVAITREAIVRLVHEAAWLQWRDQTFLLHSAFAFDATLLELFGPLLNGGTLAVAPEGPLSLTELGAAIRENAVTTLWLTAGLFNAMLDHRCDDLRRVQQLLAGGDVLSVPSIAKAAAALPDTRLFNGYGPTENTTFTCVHAITAADLAGTAIPIGKPITGTSVRVLDTAGNLCPIGVPGEIYTGGHGLAQGYWGDPERTAARFVTWRGERLYRTGDLAKWLPDGTLAFLGRTDTQIKLRGFRIELGEIEAALLAQPGVRDTVVTVHGTAPDDKRLVAYVVGSASLEPLRKTLPGYLVPSALVTLEALPLNTNGKVDRAALPEPRLPERAVATPTSPECAALGTLFAEVLGLPTVGPDDDFFALGGSSLQAVRLFARLESEQGVRLPMTALFAFPTPALLATQLDHAPTEPSTEAPHGRLVPIRETGSRPPLFLIHHAQGIVVLYQALAQHLGDDQPVYGIEASGVAGGPLHTQIEEMADDYLQLIRSAFPDGPYHLGGFSSGGIIALEVARRLAAQGATVGPVALLDTYAPAYHRQFQETDQEHTPLRRLAAHWNIFRKLEMRDQGEYLKQRLQKVQDRREQGEPLPFDSDLVTRLDLLRETQEAALRAFEPPCYSGPVTLYRAEERPSLGPWDTRLFWGETLPALEICVVPGDHHLLIQEPFVRTLAQRLRERLS